jgi:hypothetical protein
VTKPTVRRGGGDFSERRSAIMFIVGLIVPKLSGLASSFGVALEFILANGLTPQSHISDFPELSEAIPGISLKAA